MVPQKNTIFTFFPFSRKRNGNTLDEGWNELYKYTDQHHAVFCDRENNSRNL